MREIVIKTVYREGKDHVVRLGNGTAHKFTSDKAARKFLAETNRFLSQSLFQCNSLLAELYTHGREVWINTDEIREYDQFGDKYRSLEDFLKQSYRRASWAAGNYFSFIDLQKFCEGYKGLIKFLRNVRNVTQSDTLRRHKLEFLFDHIQAIEMRLLNYGQLQAFEHFNTSRLHYQASLSHSEKSHLRIA